MPSRAQAFARWVASRGSPSEHSPDLPVHVTAGFGEPRVLEARESDGDGTAVATLGRRAGERRAERSCAPRVRGGGARPAPRGRRALMLSQLRHGPSPLAGAGALAQVLRRPEREGPREARRRSALRRPFGFCGRDERRPELLDFDATGMWVLARRRERGTFAWPRSTPEGGRLELHHEELLSILCDHDADGARERTHCRRTASASRDLSRSTGTEPPRSTENFHGWPPRSSARRRPTSAGSWSAVIASSRS